MGEGSSELKAVKARLDQLEAWIPRVRRLLADLRSRLEALEGHVPVLDGAVEGLWDEVRKGKSEAKPAKRKKAQRKAGK